MIYFRVSNTKNFNCNFFSIFRYFEALFSIVTIELLQVHVRQISGTYCELDSITTRFNGQLSKRIKCDSLILRNFKCKL